MRQGDLRSYAGSERVRGIDLLGKDARAFRRETFALDAVEDGQCGVRREARQHHRLDVVSPPGEEVGQVGPVDLVFDALFDGFEPVTISRSGVL